MIVEGERGYLFTQPGAEESRNSKMYLKISELVLIILATYLYGHNLSL